MIHKQFVKTILANKVYDYKLVSKRCSTLFMNGPKATDNFVYLTPHLDFPEQLKEKDFIQADLNKRKAQINLNKLENLWKIYEDLKSKKFDFDKKREVVSKELGELLKAKKEGNDVERLRIQNSLLKENIKKLKVPLWSAEEAAIVESLKVPNKLHFLTPESKEEVIYEYQSPIPSNKNHLGIGEGKFISFNKNENYYFKSDAAIFELGSKFYFSKILKQNEFIQFSNPDFTKSLVIEGCGEDHTNADATFILHHNEDTKVNPDSRLHLTGAGSLYSFFAYHAKNVIHGKSLPLKYFSMGRHYVPSPVDEDSLFHVSQSSVVQIFGATESSEEMNDLLKNIISIIKESYSKLGYHFRLVYVPAYQLKMWESLRLAIQMYSSSLKCYVEIGNISVSGDFISKRLMFTYTENKEHKFPHVISGTILNVPKFLACVLEQDKDFKLPEEFKVERWSTVETI